jgi:hypothetical protein
MSVRRRSTNGRIVEELKVISLRSRGWAIVHSLLATRETANSIESSSKQSKIINITSTGRLFRFAIAGFIYSWDEHKPRKKEPEACTRYISMG